MATKRLLSPSEVSSPRRALPTWNKAQKNFTSKFVCAGFSSATMRSTCALRACSSEGSSPGDVGSNTVNRCALCIVGNVTETNSTQSVSRVVFVGNVAGNGTSSKVSIAASSTLP